jgi:hypothetical protein
MITNDNTPAGKGTTEEGKEGRKTKGQKGNGNKGGRAGWEDRRKGTDLLNSKKITQQPGKTRQAQLNSTQLRPLFSLSHPPSGRKGGREG